jgi:hypothetical protein
MAAAVNGSWAYAVPLDETNGFPQPQRTDTLRSQNSTTPPTPAASYGQKRSASSQRRPSDFGIQSDTEAVGSRKASIRSSNASAAGRKRSRNALRESKQERKEENVDDSAWIHRDKLAQIEIQEMEEAGIHVRQSRRSSSLGPEAKGRTSRSASRARRPSKDAQSDFAEEEHAGPQYTSFDDYQRKRVSTIPAADEEEQEYERRQTAAGQYDPTVDSELRTPEEVAAEQQSHKQHMIRPSTSRIPISKASVVPVPQQVVDRDSPLPRSRHGSGAWSGAWDDQQYARKARSGSVGSQVMLDDTDGDRTSGSRPTSAHLQDANENSPPKARMPGKAGPSGRKPSTSSPRPGSSSVKSPRSTSTANDKRPKSSHKSRPSTSHAPPEGEAPWIASMYKPDPRLPPDQQMLPTHAKRMMQEQWEKDGKTGTAYDREFNLLNDKPIPQPSKIPKLNMDTPTPHFSPTKAGAQADLGSPSSTAEKPWPLSPAKNTDNQSETGSIRPGTSGGYKITPTITTPPVQPQSRSPNPSNPAAPHNATPRVPDYDEKDQFSEKKKGCGCCIVM